MVDKSKLEMIPCPRCGKPFPKLRKELGYNYCVNCSTEQKVVCLTEDVGEGDNCYTRTIVMSPQEAFEINKAKAYFRGNRVATSDLEPELNTKSFEEEDDCISTIIPTAKDFEKEQLEEDLEEGFEIADNIERNSKVAESMGIVGLFEEEEEKENSSEEDTEEI